MPTATIAATTEAEAASSAMGGRARSVLAIQVPGHSDPLRQEGIQLPRSVETGLCHVVVPTPTAIVILR